MTLGYTGKWMASSIDMSLVVEKVPAEYAEGSVVCMPHPDDPALVGEDIFELYSEFNRRWPGEWGSGEGTSGANVYSLLVEGMKLADSVDPVAVREALLATDPIEHPYLGEAYWGGAEMYGANNFLMAPWYVGEVVEGKPTAMELVPFYDWYEANKDVVFSEFEAAGHETYR